jgi:NADPH:quinone reductase
MGARVLAGMVRPKKAAAVRTSGAYAVIDWSRADMREALHQQLCTATEGRGADVILDPLGGEVFNSAVRVLAWRGRLVVIGFAAGAIPTLRTNYLLLKNIEVSGLQISDHRKRRPAQAGVTFAVIFALFEAGNIRPAAATEYALDRAGEALIALRDRRIDGRAVLRLRTDSNRM